MRGQASRQRTAANRAPTVAWHRSHTVTTDHTRRGPRLAYRTGRRRLGAHPVRGPRPVRGDRPDARLGAAARSPSPGAAASRPVSIPRRPGHRSSWSTTTLERWRSRHPLAPVLPVIRRLLVDDAVEAGLLVAVSDADGRLLWVEGQARIRRDAERIHFVEGACWSEARAGTNAPGTALALDQPVQIFAAEHLARPVTRWSCTAAPIHDPDSGAVLGVLDLTGGDEVAAPRTLSLVRATVAAVESELRVRRLQGADPAPPPEDRMVLRALGSPTATFGDARAATRLGLRHSELLVLLASYPDGISGDRLATLLRDQELAAVTLRAELSRLRSILAPITLHSRPYRLEQPAAHRRQRGPRAPDPRPGARRGRAVRRTAAARVGGARRGRAARVPAHADARRGARRARPRAAAPLRRHRARPRRLGAVARRGPHPARGRGAPAGPCAPAPARPTSLLIRRQRCRNVVVPSVAAPPGSPPGADDVQEHRA